jgi:signal transduction histidine kinase
MEDEVISSVEGRLVRLDGVVIDVEVTAIPFRHEGQPALQMIVRDVTERRRLEAERWELEQREQVARAAATAAAEADRLKGELINTVSHELRTPLGAIKGFTTLLLTYRDQIPDDELHEYLGEIDGAADRLHELVDNLLRLAQLETGDLRMERRPVSVADMLTAAVEEARRRHPDREIRLRIAHGMLPVQGDGRRLGQVAANLLDNAVKYSPDGGPVEVEAQSIAGQVTFSVTDRGLGIPEAARGRIFERFYRVETGRAGEIGGTGLGLAICHRIVEAHGGVMTVESTEGAGSTFTVTLPVE